MSDYNDPTQPLVVHSRAQQQQRRRLVSSTEHRDDHEAGAVEAPVSARRRRARELASSKAKHYFVLGLVSLDVACILTIIFITLIACDRGEEKEEWAVRAKDALEVAGLVFSSLFLLELLWTIWAFGLRFLCDWFHAFDAVIISASFCIDVLAHGLVEEIGSLVIIFRLWRFVKVVEEISAGCAEQMEDIEAHVEELSCENVDLKRQIEALRNERWETDNAYMAPGIGNNYSVPR